MNDTARKAVSIVKRQVDEQSLNPYLGNRSLLAQRLTGLGITFYLFTHMLVIGSIARGPDAFDRMLLRVTHPEGVFAILEFLLLLLIGFHALNGIRVTALEFGGLTKRHRASVVVMLVVFCAAALVGGVAFFSRLAR